MTGSREGPGRMSETLSFLLEERGETATSVSRATGVPRSTISSWLAGRNARDLHQVRKVARYLGTSFEFLVFGEVERCDVQALLLDRMFEGPLRLKVERLRGGSDSRHIDQTQGKPATP